ncbi:extracellular solute-binding protein [Lactococcus fujiensis]|uniref:Maltose ABC transporter substrate-binding protein n=1 Tax=Lactococcus fujiensis JCM 16395 TaxID=1291764 RepID=A0A2A5RPI9_9LACT|nr:extracellular solute-binding protein [Lactococcus fujiensis]PCS01351.1 maltose ABC transporter substrate-binding protein [Lactococcus fujiensis JCM 16395]
MNSWKKVALGGASVLAIATLAACGNSSTSSTKTSSSSTSPKDIKGNVSLMVDTATVPSYKELAKSFMKEYPNVTVTVATNPNGSANAKQDIAKDPTKYADVFKVPNDQLGALAEAGYINPLPAKQVSWIKSNGIDIASTSVTWKGEVYAYPQDQQSNVIYYNKAKMKTAPTTWTDFTATTALGTDFSNSYNWYPAFLSNGTVLFGKDGETLTGTDADSSKGVEVLNWFAKQKANAGVKNSGSALLADFQAGKTTAVLDGPWDATNIKKFLGDNMGVTTLPTIDFGSGAKQMQAFSGVGTLAINAKTPSADIAAANALAQYLSNEESQMTLYKEQAAIPVANNAQKDSTITSDPVAQAVIKQVANDTLMPKMPEMATFWTEAAPIIQNAYLGKTPTSQFQSQLTKFVGDISKATN